MTLQRQTYAETDHHQSRECEGRDPASETQSLGPLPQTTPTEIARDADRRAVARRDQLFGKLTHFEGEPMPPSARVKVQRHSYRPFHGDTEPSRSSPTEVTRADSFKRPMSQLRPERVIS